ncbi:SseB family protein [Butyrivibrio sp. X503]|uniref:SseB family protein n=1 Tax=Butyrivibrio sp. X503 TaxID=2364878 RepID=UPI0013141AF5|nr:SseB family protein [Butyrivibrio sp. X503]
MGIFNLFSKDNGKDVEEAFEKEKAAEKEKAIEEVKKAHENLRWPVVSRINKINIKDAECEFLEDTVTLERKNEIGVLIYEEDIDTNVIKELTSQELLFLLTTLEAYHKESPLPEYEKNHRKVYNEVLNRIRNAETLFVLYDAGTRYPFIDGGFVNVYFEKDLASKAAALYMKQFRKIVVNEVKNISDASLGKGFFDYLYYIGIENLIIDNGAYKAKFKRNEIVMAVGDWKGNTGNEPVNPALNFTMLDFITELSWPVNYEQKSEVLKAKEARMVACIKKGNFIVPMQHEGDVEVLEDGRMKPGKDTKFKFPVIKTKEGKEYLPIFTDGLEFSKKLNGSGWNAAVFKYADVIKFAKDKDGIRINPDGQGIVIPKERMEAI